MGRLLLLFILLPAVELSLLIELGGHIGTLATLGVIAVTGFVGATLARSQGLRVWSHVQREIAAGGLPADSLIDGLMILIAGALLITPGVLTDAFGFLCLVPGFRSLVKRELVRRFERAVAEQRIVMNVNPFDLAAPGPIVDVSSESSEGDDLDAPPPPDRILH